MNPVAQRLEIVGVGARTPVGLDALQTAMCARAKKLEPRATEFRDRRGWPVGLCLVGGIGGEVYGLPRFVALGTPALAEACEGIAVKMPLVMVLPEPGRADDDERFATQLARDLAAGSGVPLDVAGSVVLREGNAGIASALQWAARMLDDREVPAVVVGAIDSYHHPGVLRALEDEHRLHAPSTENGFIPSEAAAFCVVARRPLRRSESIFGVPLAKLGAVRAEEEDTVRTGEPDVARALTEAVNGALSDAGVPVGTTISDVNGERHRVLEWSRVRVRATLGENVDAVRVPDLCGDVGAASGGVMIALATQWWRTVSTSALSVLCTVASDGARRGAWVMEAP